MPAAGVVRPTEPTTPSNRGGAVERPQPVRAPPSPTSSSHNRQKRRRNNLERPPHLLSALVGPPRRTDMVSAGVNESFFSSRASEMGGRGDGGGSPPADSMKGAPREKVTTDLDCQPHQQEQQRNVSLRGDEREVRRKSTIAPAESPWISPPRDTGGEAMGARKVEQAGEGANNRGRVNRAQWGRVGRQNVRHHTRVDGEPVCAAPAIAFHSSMSIYLSNKIAGWKAACAKGWWILPQAVVPRSGPPWSAPVAETMYFPGRLSVRRPSGQRLDKHARVRSKHAVAQAPSDWAW